MQQTRFENGSGLAAFGWLAGFAAFTLANALLYLGLDWWPGTVEHHHLVWFGIITLGISAMSVRLAVFDYKWGGFVYMCAAAAACLATYAAYAVGR